MERSRYAVAGCNLDTQALPHLHSYVIIAVHTSSPPAHLLRHWLTGSQLNKRGGLFRTSPPCSHPKHLKFIDCAFVTFFFFLGIHQPFKVRVSLHTTPADFWAVGRILGGECGWWAIETVVVSYCCIGLSQGFVWMKHKAQSQYCLHMMFPTSFVD